MDDQTAVIELLNALNDIVSDCINQSNGDHSGSIPTHDAEILIRDIVKSTGIKLDFPFWEE